MLSVPKEHMFYESIHKKVQKWAKLIICAVRNMESGLSLREEVSYWNGAEGDFQVTVTALFLPVDSSYMESSVCGNSSSCSLGQRCPV